MTEQQTERSIHEAEIRGYLATIADLRAQVEAAIRQRDDQTHLLTDQWHTMRKRAELAEQRVVTLTNANNDLNVQCATQLTQLYEEQQGWQRAERERDDARAQHVECQRARIGDAEIIGRWQCRADEVEQQIARVRAECETSGLSIGGLPVVSIRRVLALLPAPTAPATTERFADGRDARCQCQVFETCEYCRPATTEPPASQFLNVQPDPETGEPLIVRATKDSPAKCPNGQHEWSNNFGDDWTPDHGERCDCGQKQWGVVVSAVATTATREP